MSLWRFLGTLFSGLVLVFSACVNSPVDSTANPRLVSAYTAGRIPASNPIQIEFTQDIDASSSIDSASLFQFSPTIEGQITWTTPRLLTFKPLKPLVRGINYQANFKASTLQKQIPDLEDFSFSFRAIDQGLEIDLGSVQIQSDSSALVEGTLKTLDKAEAKAIEDMLQLEPSPQGISVLWNHNGDGLSHHFTIANLPRTEQSQRLKLLWDGKGIDSAAKGLIDFEIPGSKTFSFLGAKAVSTDEEYIEVAFSDLIDRDQDLRGLIVADDHADLGFVIKGNLVRVYNASGWQRQETLELRSDIRNRRQQNLVANNNVQVVFPSKLPEVRFASQGNILPTSQGTTLAIETMNLNSVMVEATQIHQNNVGQFLQVNNLSGESEIYRVGTVVWRDVITLGWTNDQTDRWIRRGIDLAPLLKKYGDGFFRIRLTFRRPHIQWQGSTNANGAKSNFTDETINTNIESSYWDGVEEYYYDYDYSKRKDPNADEFYMKFSDHNVTTDRNVLVSDVGIIARRGMDNKLIVVLSDLKTAKPLANIPVVIENYQRQSLVQANTDVNGFAIFEDTPQGAFLVTAKSNNQYGYVRLVEGEALAVSHFDIAGEEIENGVNGLIYGERGVWRPGNTMHLTFLLNDPKKSIPNNHPVQMTLYDPQGKARQTKTLSTSLNGFYYFTMSTAESDPTGNWLAEVTLGNRSFKKNLKVETVIPNRLKIELKPDGDGKTITGNINGTLHAEWLHGAPSPNLQADIKAYLEASRTVFGGEYSDFSFDDSTRTLSFEATDIFNGKLDASGSTRFGVNAFDVSRSAPGKLRLILSTRVFEEAGVFSSESQSFDYHPFSRYVGLSLPKGDASRNMLLTDIDHPVRIAMLNTDGSKVANGKVRMEVFQARWRWWWETGEDNDGDYREEQNLTLISRTEGLIVNGATNLSFKINYPAWGRYLVRVSDVDGGHAASSYVYVDWPGWAGRSSKDGPGGASMLVLSSAKTNHKVGDTIQVSIPGNDQAKALVAIEAGGAVLRQEWISLKGKTTEYTFTATAAMAPNIYVHVTLLQPHAQTVNDLPIRMYGVIPIFVEDPASRLNPVIVSDNEWKPQSTIKVKVSESQGKAMTYTLAIVDEGLLGLTRYRTPNPWDTFFARQASLLKTWDLYRYVMGAYSGKLESLIAIGGGDDAANNARKKNDRFPPVVLYEVPRTLQAGTTNEHTLILPPYMGAVRVMVVAAQAGAFGRAEKSVPVRNVLMAQATAPRVLSPDEEFRLPVTLFYSGTVPQTVTVNLTTKGLLSSTGPVRQTVQFNEVGEKLVYFQLKTASALGLAELNVLAEDRANNRMEENIKILVRQTAQAETKVLEGELKSSGATYKADLALLSGLPGSNSMIMELSSIPPIDLGRRLDYLIQYPHGCLEQTTSSVFPQLFLADVMELDADKKNRTKLNVELGIERLKSFQLASGGFSYWPGQVETNVWANIYAGHFLLEARRAGYNVPETLLGPWIQNQKLVAQSWKNTSSSAQIVQAYRLYVLSMANEFLMGQLNVLREQKLEPGALYLVAAAYKRGGQDDAARRMITGDSVIIKPYRELGESFGSDFRDKAILLDTMLQLGLESKAMVLAREIAGSLSSRSWLSTQETAMGLMAISRFALSTGGINKPIQVKVKLGGKDLGTMTTARPLLTFESGLDSYSNRNLEITNLASNFVYVRVLVKGIPSIGNERILADGLKMRVWYMGANNRTLRNFDTSASSSPSNFQEALKQNPTANAPIAQGTDITVVVSITNTSTTIDYQQLALSHLFPAGFEIINTRLAGITDNSKPVYEYQDIRDDRILSYLSLKRGETKTFNYRVNAAYVGHFRLPTVRVEAMYDATIQAQIPGQWLDIISPQAK